MKTQLLTLTLELTANQAAALKRFADKVSYTGATSVLYPHISACVRAEQAADILSAFAQLEQALAHSHVSAWPWIDTGCSGRNDPV
jgi:hypothetical protein